ncbi:MAG: 2-hydroxyglutaryl-CoA dehydratase [Deltaproteobacteria bacterium]|nr:2-hydroxyglutaryl-CoA dehydratase [Deltaproteobacteria bacterium]
MEATGNISLNTIDIDAEMAAFEAEERAKLGLTMAEATTKAWTDKMTNPFFSAKQRENTTLLVSGLTMAHDLFVEAALKGLGYNIRHLDCPDNDALRFGKEFGNRGQCNPTYFTVGNLVKSLTEIGEKEGLTKQGVIDKYVFLTAGACGPCRFGMYVTEYRKALRDAGFDGFRVLLFQQTGGFKQATGEEVGLKMNPPFFMALARAIISGDVLNALAYRIRPFEVEAGATDKAMDAAKKLIYAALEHQTNILVALWKARGEFKKVKVNRLMPKPKVSIIGEFWAMTTEGDGNYQLQRFLEGEGAEVDIQLVTAWLLFMLWEGRHDTKLRAELHGVDGGRKGLSGVNVMKKLAMLRVAEWVVRGAFQTFAQTIGLRGYHLPDMEEIARVAAPYYNNMIRGGEAHMEIGKVILNTVKQKATMTLSVKPFGCMPSSGVSDGVQSYITEKHPESIFCAVETSGDGRVNFYSRVQMFLFRARERAREEFDAALKAHGLTAEAVAAFLAKHPRFASPLHKAPHTVAGTAADLVHEVAPYMTKSFAARRVANAKTLAGWIAQTVRAIPGQLRHAAKRAPELARAASAEWKEIGPDVRQMLVAAVKEKFVAWNPVAMGAYDDAGSAPQTDRSAKAA